MTDAPQEQKKPRLRLPNVPRPPKQVVIALMILLGCGIFVLAASAATQITFRGRIYPQVAIGGVSVGGLDKITAQEKVQDAYDAMLNDGLTVTVDGEAAEIALRAVSEEFTYDLVDIDVNAEVEAAYQAGRDGSFVENAGMALALSTFLNVDHLQTVTFDRERLEDAIRAAFPHAETPVVPTDFIITPKGDTFEVTISAPVDGTAFLFTPTHAALERDVRDLTLTATEVALTVVQSDVSAAEAEALIPDVLATLKYAPYTLAHTPETRTQPLTWEITQDDLITWLIPGHDELGDVIVTLDSTAMAALLTEMHTEVDVAAQDAKFAMENSRVTEFVPSHDGVTVNDVQTIAAAAAFLGTENAEIMVVVDRVEPEITTAESNDLGIQDMLGQGYSSFKGSPTNRIGNITHGAEKLHGVLIAPGETKSLIELLSPITIADGFLPELVIKGDEIKPEVGGGLCQIGTTTFRAVMNSGLKVVERRNHSLVVSYYNDPSNNNPGTDATIYEPSPDFKFQNDMANYVLLTTEVDMETLELFFTFWGTSDGRNGSYEPPQVLSWTGYGPTQYKQTDTLAPGVQKCQSPHPGATTTFTYNVTYGDGTTFEQEFTSTYRALAQICLVGKDAAAEEASTDGTSTDTTDTETSADATEEPVPVE